MVKDKILAEEQSAIMAKGFADPIRTYKVVDAHDGLEAEGLIIRKEQDGLHVMIDFAKQDKMAAIDAIKDVLSQLEDLRALRR